MQKEIQTFDTADVLARAAADFFVKQSQIAIQSKGSFKVALSGGSTPKRLFSILRDESYRSKVDWHNCLIFFGDERYVPHDHPDSNYLMAKQTLFDHIDIPKTNIFPIPTSGDSAQADAETYEQILLELLNDGKCFDLVFLGLGPDGHTASLFPGTTALKEQEHLVCATYVDKLESWRITLSYPFIHSARQVMFLVEGEAKASVLKEILVDNDSTHPATQIRAAECLHWYLDQEAALQLTSLNV